MEDTFTLPHSFKQLPREIGGVLPVLVDAVQLADKHPVFNWEGDKDMHCSWHSSAERSDRK